MAEIQKDVVSTSPPDFYSKNAIHLATVLGGPIATGYLLNQNFHVFNEPDKARVSLLTGAALTALIVVLLVALPSDISDQIPKQLIPLLYLLGEYFVVKKYQAVLIDKHIGSGGKAFSMWRAAGIGLVSALLTIAPFFFFVHDDSSTPAKSVRTFGSNKSEIYYDSTMLSVGQVDSLGEEFLSVGFFNEGRQKYVLLTRRDNVFDVVIPTVKDAWLNSDAIGYFKAVRDTLQALNSDKIILLDLAYPDMSTIQLTVGSSVSKPNLK